MKWANKKMLKLLKLLENSRIFVLELLKLTGGRLFWWGALFVFTADVKLIQNVFDGIHDVQWFRENNTNVFVTLNSLHLATI